MAKHRFHSIEFTRQVAQEFMRAKRSIALGDIRIGAVGAALFPYHLDRSKLFCDGPNFHKRRSRCCKDGPCD